MAQNTEVDARPTAPAENTSTPATAPAQPPAGARASDYLRERPRTRLFLIFAVLAVLVVIFFAWRYFSSYESTDDAEVDGHVMPISARISGYVAKVNVDDNQDTAQSLTINVPVTSVSTSSDVSSSEAGIANAEAGISAAQQQFDAAQAQLVQAQANDVKAQNDLVRYKQLVDKQEVSQQTYDQAVASAAANDAGV